MARSVARWARTLGALLVCTALLVCAFPGPARAAGLTLVPQFGHKKAVRAVAFAPSGEWIASADDDLLIWNARTGLLVRRIKTGSPDSVTSIRWLPDSRRLLTAGGGDGTARLWDIETGAELRAMRHPGGRIQVMALARDGRTAATGGSEGHVALWDVETGALSATLKGHTDRVTALAFFADGKRLISASEDDTTRLWDLAKGASVWSRAPERKLWIHFSDGTRKPTGKTTKLEVNDLALSPDGRSFVTGNFGGAWLWSAADGEVVRELEGIDSVDQVVWSSDGATIVGAREKRATIWDAASGKIRGELTGNPGSVAALAISSDGARVVSGGGDGSVRSWELSSRSPLLTFPAHSGQIQTVALSSDGGRALSAGGAIEASGSDSSLHLWDLRSGAHLRTLRGHTGLVSSAVFSKDGRIAVSGGSDGAIVWDLQNGRLLRKLGDPSAGGGNVIRGAMLGVRAVAITPDGRTVIGGCGDHVVRVWDVETGGVVERLTGHTEPLMAVALSPDGQLVASGGWDRSIRIWDRSTWRARVIPGHQRWVSSLSFSGDGKKLLSGGFDKTIRLWDVARGKELSRIPAASAVLSVSLSSDGRVAVSGSDEGVTLWDISAGKPLRTFQGHTAAVQAVALSPDGQLALSGGMDGTMRLSRADGAASMAMVAQGDDWLLYNDDGAFDASRGGERLVAAVEGSKSYRIDQLALRNNRPDKVLAPVGLAPAPLLAHFRARHERRLAKLGIEEGALAARFDDAPTARIDRLQEDGSSVELTATLDARRADLYRYNIHVNAVPLLGGQGKAISGRSQRVTERIELTAGTNRIEISALDAGGVESLRDLRVVTRPGPARGDLYFLGFGVSRYRDARLDLQFAAKDILDLGAALQAAAGRGEIERVHVRTYVDEQATAASIEAARAFLEPARVNDVIVLMVAGHGVTARDPAGTYYFVTHDADVKRLAATAAPFESLEGLLQGVRARRKLFLLDTCESGERDEAVVAPSARSGARRLIPRTTRALALEGASGAAPRVSRLGRERYIYNELDRRSGAIVFSSSYGDEASYELGEVGNGAFTRALLEALTSPVADADRDQQVSLRELRDYVIPRVAKSTDGYQHPVVDRDNPDLSLSLPVVEGTLPTLGAASPRAAPSDSDPFRLPPGAGGCGCGFGEAPAARIGALLIAVTALAARSRRRRPRIDMNRRME